MSNFSRVYQCYLWGYSDSVGDQRAERECQAFALGVFHSRANRPPLMRSVDVVAELRRMRGQAEQTFFDVTLKATDRGNIIAAIKAVREVTSLGLKEAKDVVDRVNAGAQEIVLAGVDRTRADAAAKTLRDYGCTVEVA